MTTICASKELLKDRGLSLWAKRNLSTSQQSYFSEDIMRLSHESVELAELQYLKAAGEISSKYHQAVRKCEQTMLRGGAMKAAIDEEYIQMAKELVQSRLDTYLEAFRRENLIPNEDDVNQICFKLEGIVNGISHNTHHPARPSSQERYGTIVRNARMELVIAIKQLQLEARELKTQSVSAVQDSPNVSGRDNAKQANAPLSVDDFDLLELKPNVFGIGINLNHLIKRCLNWIKSRKKIISSPNLPQRE